VPAGVCTSSADTRASSTPHKGTYFGSVIHVSSLPESRLPHPQQFAMRGQRFVTCVQTTVSPSAAAVIAQPGNSSLDDSTPTAAVAPSESQPRAPAAQLPDATGAAPESKGMPNGSSHAAVVAQQLSLPSEPESAAQFLARSATAAPPAAIAGSVASGQAQPSSDPDVDAMVGPLRIRMDASSPSADITLDSEGGSARQVSYSDAHE
jgi:hypothetical protein